MPCKSLRFVVSPLTVPVEHDRRRCIGRNTIISAVNKFLHGVSLSTKSSCPTDFQLSLPGRVPNPRRDILGSPRQGDTITADLRRSIAPKKTTVCYVLLIDYNFSAPTVDWRLLYRSAFFTCRDSIRDSLTFCWIGYWAKITPIILRAKK